MKIHFIAATLLCFGGMTSLAQKQSDPLLYNKKKLDSLFRSMPEQNQLHSLILPKGFSVPESVFTEKMNGSFQSENPSATIVNKTSNGIIYNMPLDNMAVLVPDMNAVEQMPGSKRQYHTSLRNAMPNPLYPAK